MEPERIFDACRDPAQLNQWWGPNGSTTTTHDPEFRPGGIWHFSTIAHVGQQGAIYGRDNRIAELLAEQVEVDRLG